MLSCLHASGLNISRLLTFACSVSVLLLVVPSPLVSTVHGALEPTPFSLANRTNTSDETCVAEVLDLTLPYFSLPYRIFAGALVVPITFCAITGNILVIYVIKHYRALRITGNVFLASLAVADVGVSTLAMTFYGLQLLQGRWILGAVSERNARCRCFDFSLSLVYLERSLFSLIERSN
jgi:hypothetical protein